MHEVRPSCSSMCHALQSLGSTSHLGHAPVLLRIPVQQQTQLPLPPASIGLVEAQRLAPLWRLPALLYQPPGPPAEHAAVVVPELF